ncbi:hypothetical protein [Fulvivirga ligni]|uniref:hypothetical protein n=1 Tax=Fulvivirga ligni TaxID=2904246 RepID=UPI001F40FB48|nr:hypothetical protein [Fulvivirga ligni]UII21589.1 hypothetical protein LVD16_27555 [Fulvivirga ligni]
MKKKHWLMSFRKYDTDEDRWGMDFLKGGRSELASEFGNIVKQYPSTEKLEIIKAVIESDNLPIEYAISGLYGWTQSGADLNLILPLFENVLEKDFSNQEVYITSLAGSLVNQDKTSLKVINYLVKTSLRFKNENAATFVADNANTSINGLYTTAINTLHGDAVNNLLRTRDNSFKKTIFDTVAYILENGPPEISSRNLLSLPLSQ